MLRTFALPPLFSPSLVAVVLSGCEDFSSHNSVVDNIKKEGKVTVTRMRRGVCVCLGGRVFHLCIFGGLNGVCVRACVHERV